MKTYTSKVGDTISKIAFKHGIRPFDLLLFNSQLLHEKMYIYPGEKLVIPQSKASIQYSPHSCYAEYGPTDLEEDVAKIQHQFHSLCHVSTIGHSVMGKPLYVFTIGNGPKPIFYSGSWHGNEWLTSKFLMSFLKELLEKLTDKKEKWHGYDLPDIFSKISLSIMPMVNPDGVELVQQGIYPAHPYYKDVLQINKGAREFDHWSSNIRGVDLNHQWPAGWNVEAEESPPIPWPRHYSGTGPLTEPEALAVYKYTLKNDFAHVLAFHSQGQVIYWGYKHLEPKESKAMVERLSLVSSYTPVHTADSDGGYKDWFIKETGKPGFTIEVGVGTNPLPFSAYPEIWANNVMLALEGLCL